MGTPALVIHLLPSVAHLVPSGTCCSFFLWLPINTPSRLCISGHPAIELGFVTISSVSAQFTFGSFCFRGVIHFSMFSPKTRADILSLKSERKLCQQPYPCRRFIVFLSSDSSLICASIAFKTYRFFLYKKVRSETCSRLRQIFRDYRFKSSGQDSCEF